MSPEDIPFVGGMKQKRRRKVLTLHEKMNILAKIDQGRTYSSVAREYGCNESSIRTIKKSEDKIRRSVSMLADPAQVKTTCMSRRDTLIEQTERLLNVWIDEQTAMNVPLTSNMIRAQARTTYERLKSMKPKTAATNESSFSASKGWFERFRRRANLHNIVVVSESPAADDTAESFKKSTCWTKVSPLENSEAQEQASFSTEINKIISLSNTIEREAFSQQEPPENSDDCSTRTEAEVREDWKEGEVVQLQVEVDVRDILSNEDPVVKPPESKAGISVNISKIMKAAQFLKKKIMQEDPDAERSFRIRREIDALMQAYDGAREAQEPVEPMEPEVELLSPEVEDEDSIQMSIPSTDDFSNS